MPILGKKKQAVKSVQQVPGNNTIKDIEYKATFIVLDYVQIMPTINILHKKTLKSPHIIYSYEKHVTSNIFTRDV